MEAAAFAFLGALAGGVIVVLGNLVLASRQSEQRVREHRYAKQYERQLELIAEMYQRVVRAEAASQFVGYPVVRDASGSARGTWEANDDRAWNRLREAHWFFVEHRLYFNPTVIQTAERFVHEASRALREYEDMALRPEFTQVTYSDGAERVYRTLPELRKVLENEFRSILHLEEPRTSGRWWARSGR